MKRKRVDQKRWRFRTLPEPPLPARPMASFIHWRARRSASPRPKHLPRRWRRCSCSRCIFRQARETLAPDLREHYVRELLDLPAKLRTLLECASQCEQIATEFHKVDDFLFLGRAIHYPIAMDGALKLKEVSYVHAEGYPTGETKHGPNALIDENLPVVIIATRDANDQGSVLRYEKSLGNIEGFKKQSSRVIALVSEDDKEIRKSRIIPSPFPQTPELLSPILEIVPLQLFAYYMAVKRGLDVDRPRNLVKSVTLE